jgi:hypothetical protein
MEYMPNITNGQVTGADNLPTQYKDALNNLASALLNCKNVLGPFQLEELLYQYGAGNRQYDGVTFKDGEKMSVQASHRHYSTKELTFDGATAFSSLEVWDKKSMEEPETITPSEFMQFVQTHGGIVSGSIPPFNFGRDPMRPKRELDSEVMDLKIRKSQRTGDLAFKLFRGRISKWRVKTNDFGGNVVGIWDGESFSSSTLAKQIMFDDGMYKFETKNSLYAAFEDDRIVVDAEVICGSDGRISLSVLATPTSVRVFNY